MTQACDLLHHYAQVLTRYQAGYTPTGLPQNGIYLVFERGENAHNGERIVRIGTHRGDNNLCKRLNEHLYTANKDRSIFRKHIGRCLLNKNNDSFAELWEIDLTTKSAREEHGHRVDLYKLAEIEAKVSDYITNNFSFALLSIPQKTDRIKFEAGLIGTLAQCSCCQPSENWLGKYHPKEAVRKSGLWNIQGLEDAGLSVTDIEILFGSI